MCGLRSLIYGGHIERSMPQMKPIGGQLAVRFHQPHTIAMLLLASVLTFFAGTTSYATDERAPTPVAEDLIALIRQSVLAVDEGNKSGDYSKLYGLGSTEFKAAHPVASLSDEFKTLRESGVDMSLAAEKQPLTTGPPRMDINGLLRMTGLFKFPDKELVYDLLYKHDTASNTWQLAGIALRPRVLEEPPEIMQPQ
jgi:hypothetical protein